MIIIAALVLVVLVVLVMVLTGYMGKVWKPGFASATDTCQGLGGQVVESSQSCSPPLKTSSKSYSDVLDGQKCCLPLSCSDVGGFCKSTPCDAQNNEFSQNAPGCGSKNCCALPW